MPELKDVSPRMWKRTVTFAGVGDDATNNAAAFTSLIDSTVAYDRIVIPPGVYRTNGLVKFTAKNNITIDAWGATIRSTDQDNSAFWLNQCSDVQVNGLTHRVDSTGRGAGFEKYAYCFTECVRLEVNYIRSLNSRAAGMYWWGCTNCVAVQPEVWDSWADGFHVTGPTNYMTFVNPVAHRPGDDGFAVVSYAADSSPVSNVWVKGPRVEGQTTSGRGITIVGGTNIHYTDIYVEGSRAAGLMIAIEGPPPNVNFTTKGISNCSVRGGEIVYCNALAAGEAHGAILVLNQRPSSSGVTMDTVLVEEIEIRDNPKDTVSPVNVLNNGQTTAVMTNVRLRNLRLSGRRSTTPISIDSGITLAEQSIIQGGKWASWGVA